VPEWAKGEREDPPVGAQAPLEVLQREYIRWFCGQEVEKPARANARKRSKGESCTLIRRHALTVPTHAGEQSENAHARCTRNEERSKPDLLTAMSDDDRGGRQHDPLARTMGQTVWIACQDETLHNTFLGVPEIEAEARSLGDEIQDRSRTACFTSAG
jgi:hypothetical protein